MGASGPEHEAGDSHTSESGIVSGHAYGILEIQDFQGEQLMQMMNPHGSSERTDEWKGDWCDTDVNRWTAKAIA